MMNPTAMMNEGGMAGSSRSYRDGIPVNLENTPRSAGSSDRIIDVDELEQSRQSQSQQPMSSLEVEQPLPSIAELTGRSEGDEIPHRRRGTNTLIPVLVLLVVVLLSLTIGLALGLRGEEESKQAVVEEASKQESVEVVVDNEKRYRDVIRFLGDNEISSLLALETDGSPQQLAATFLAMLDPLLLDIPHSHEISEGYKFVTRYVMMVLYFSTNGEQWTNKWHFKTELPTCQWWEINLNRDTNRLYEYTGVICNPNGIITSLLLPDARLRGTLPTELGLLFSLRSIVLSHNRLSGALPTTMQNLLNLQDLWIADNSMTGAIPLWIHKFVGLRSLDLSYNRMAGALPVELTSLEYLEMFALDNNLFSGKITSIFNLNWAGKQSAQGLKKLRYLYLEGNHFTGQIGNDFMLLLESSGSASPLVALDLSSNYLTGTLPSHIFSNFPSLVVFDANKNLLTGKLPLNVLPNESLEFLALHGNQLTGEVSGLLPDLQSLTHLDLSSNQFTNWHIDLGALRGLTYLFLANNPFPPDEFPSFVSELTNLQELSLKSTQRTGTLPAFLGTLTQLILLDLDDNQFHRTIPVDLGNLSQLQFLLLNRNQFTGGVPAQFSDLQDLRMLFLDDNELTGNLDPILCDDRDPFVVADCPVTGDSSSSSSNSLITSCTCCDVCCSKDQPCNDNNYIPSHDSVWQLGYQRFEYWFGGEEGYEVSESTP